MPELASDSVYVLGHSLGGTLAPRIAGRSKGLAGIIILAGLARPLEDALEEQFYYTSSLTDSSVNVKAQLDELKQQLVNVKKLGTEEFDEDVLHMRQLLKTKLSDQDLSVRALNCLKAADVDTVGDLVKLNRNDLLKFRNFGKKSLTELDELLTSLNLKFGMDVSIYKLDKD